MLKRTLDSLAPVYPRLYFPEKLSVDGSRLRLQTITGLRWVAVIGQTISIFTVYYGLGFELPLLPCLFVIGMSAVLNLVLQISYPASTRLVSRYAMLLLGYDILQLSLLLGLTGGLENPFALLIVVPVAVSAATQPLPITTALAGLAVVCTTVLAGFHLPLPWAGQAFNMPLTYIAGFWFALVCCIIFIAIYAWRTGHETRLMSEALAATELVLAREQRISALDGLAAAAAHKLGSPLSTIVVISKEIQNAIPEGNPLHEDAQLLRSQAMRCREILRTLTQHGGEADEHFTHLQLRLLLEEVVDLYRELGTAITVSASGKPLRDGKPSPEPVVKRNPGVIYGLGNLVENAADFAISKVEVIAGWDQDTISITISDDGPGFSASIMSRLGEPYVTTRSAVPGDDGETHGLGLGFFIAKTLLERSGATLTMANRPAPGTGAMIVVKWPRKHLEEPAGEAPLQI
jgi:two-component system, sensor histidine kinase RegB